MTSGPRRSSWRFLLGINIFWLPLSFLSDGFTALVLPFDLAELGPDWRATVLGLVSFAGLAVAILVQPWAGVFSDLTRHAWGRRATMGLGVALALPGFALYAKGGLVPVCAGYVLIMTAASVSQGGLQGLIPDLVPLSRRGLASGFKGFMDLSGAILAYVFLGSLLGSQGSGAAVGWSAALLAGGFVVTALVVKEPRTPGGASISSALRTLRRMDNPFRVNLRAHPVFGWLVAARFLFLLGAFIVGRFFLFFVEDRLGLGRDDAATQAGVLLGLLTLVSIIAGPAGGWMADRRGRLRVMRAGAALSAVGIVLLTIAGSAWHILLFGGLMAVGSGIFSAGNWAYTADVIPGPEAARYFGVANVGTMGAAAVAGLAGPLVDTGNRWSDGLGYQAALVLAAAVTLGGYFAVRRIQDRADGSSGRSGDPVTEWTSAD
ncbi:MAG: MFS transporter [Actinomycetota bacterium]